MSAEGLLGRIVVIDDEPDIQKVLTGVLSDEGHEVHATGSAAQGLELVSDKCPDLVLLDVWLPDGDGLEVLGRIRRVLPAAQVIMISGHASVETAVRATREGAIDFLEKPLGLEKVLIAVQTALKLARLSDENASLRGRIEERYRLIGESPAIERIRQQIDRIGRAQATVLVTGENGTGKENVSRSIHAVSQRSAGPFVAVNCAAIPDELMESELFGHEKGAFTGAIATHRGRFEMAHGGTIFLDEIGDMSLRTQSKLLRVLQDRAVERLGSTKAIRVDVRVVAATNKDLVACIQQGQFREDLYYRLNVLPIALPPLRERGADILMLAQHFMTQFCLENGEPVKEFSADAEALLARHNWPGNVRELKNLMERLSILVPSSRVGAGDLLQCGLGGNAALPVTVAPAAQPWLELDDFRAARAQFEKAFILAKLQECGQNVAKTADKIGMERSHLYRKLKQLEMDIPESSNQALHDR